MLQLIKEAFFKHGDENILRTCIKALGFAASESQAELQDSANHIIKETADDLLVKLRSAVTQVGVIMPNLIKLIRLSSPLLFYIVNHFLQGGCHAKDSCGQRKGCPWRS